MERHLVRPWERLLRGRERALARVGARTPELRQRSPGPGRWSMVDVVEHLILVEEQLHGALIREPSPGRPRVVPRGGWFRFLGLRAALKGGVRIRVPVDSVLPKRGLPWHDLLARWEARRLELEAWLRSVDPAILGTPRFKHPFVGWLSVPQALTFAADHLDHHLVQIDRIARAGELPP